MSNLTILGRRLRAGVLAIGVATFGVLAQQPTPTTAAPDPFAALAALPTTPPVANGAAVAVLGADGKPARDAVLVFTPWSWNGERVARWDAAMRRHLGDQLGSAADFAADGTRYRLNDEGSTRLPLQSGIVFAMRGSDFAFAMRLAENTQSPRLVLRLTAPRTLAVTARLPNGDGAPHVDVVLRDSQRLGPVLRARTGIDGRCTLRALPDANAEVTLEVTARRALQAPWPANDGEIAFALPPTTTLRATLLGELCPGAATEWSLVCVDPPPADVVQIVFPTSPGEASPQQAAWSHVEVGSRVRVQAIVDNLRAPPFDVVVPPARVHSVEVPRTTERPLLALRVLDGNGQPATRRFLRFCWKDGVDAPVGPGTTNADGWLELEVPHGTPASCELDLTLHAGGDIASARTDHGTLRVDTTAKGRRPLGDVRLAPLPVALRLQVVSPTATPVPNVTLTGFHEGWFLGRSDARGEVRIALPQPIPKTLRLGCNAPWFFADGHPDEREFTTDDALQRVAVQPAARLRFAAPGLDAAVRCDFEWQLEPAGGGGEPLVVDVPLGGGGVMMPPGDWHFVVRHGDQELVRIENLHGDAGVEVHDPRLMALDWQSFARMVTVRLERADGTPADDAYLCVVAQNTTTGQVADQGVARLLLPKGGALAYVEPTDPRYPPIHLGVLDRDRVVRIGGGPTLRCVLSAPLDLQPDVLLALTVDGEHAGQPFDAEHSAVLELPEPGAIELQLMLRRGVQRYDLARKFRVDVPKAGTTHTIVVDDELRQAIARGVKEL